MERKKSKNERKYGSYDPNAAATPGKIFGLPHTAEDAILHLIPIPSAITVSGGEGAEHGPDGILRGSEQIELFNKSYPPKAWLPGIFMRSPNGRIPRTHTDTRKIFLDLLSLPGDSKLQQVKIRNFIQEINRNCNYLNAKVQMSVQNSLNEGKIVGLVGGDHGSIFGGVQAIATKHKSFTIIQFDAHHDLRKAYEGVQYSHASIMYNILEQIPEVKQLVAIGIRSYGEDEYKYAEKNKRISTFYGDVIHTALTDLPPSNARFTWKEILEEIVGTIKTDNVYISFDIDFFEPHLCPSTGTPVPAGFNMWQAKTIIDRIAHFNTIIGFDVNEVVPKTRVDELVGAEILYHLCVRTMQSQGLYENAKK